MPTRIAEVENRVLTGMVLDEHGAWIPIADQKAVEEEYVAHLSAGLVLHDGRWVSIAEARAAERGSSEAAGGFPPETKVIVIQPQTREEPVEPPADENSGFATETAFFRVEPPRAASTSPAEQDRRNIQPATRETRMVPVSLFSYSREEEDAARRKKRSFVAGIIIVTLAGFGAAAFLIINGIIR